ncbi:gamma-glutamyl-gamma-aminobutyrate hydrolase family protein [Aliiglaciecola sp. CAU 1673]|uniref:gamma-glutamyl-gamma-aminobutyrate hydrolase family protein n=1 Tax=Aliiglaciecola sp. CAU 1673 TaxID=3032595 RepID=UPI0023DA943D|nr:gamma-glutamyl-gamma-aminobutyrate hydrolase family protein [Aliiglaciecola sp. CAU 1673]MDF2180300.1 gamma-glutamyl-gamma-aminobutyrate hydrolase family protein [Aliiglaciecola sp. CAU 1673]
MASRSRSSLYRPVIGVTGNARRFSPSWHFIRLAVYLAGGHARRISVRHALPVEWLDGLIISGGDDIHPSLYEGEIVPIGEYDEARDALELEYIQHAVDKHLPMLGICRGYQLLNVFFGGKLHQDIRPMRQRTSNIGTILPRKTALVREQSLIGKLLGKQKAMVNSLHHQAVDKSGDGFQVSAHDLDHFIQAVEHADLPVIGVQWHPEYLIYLQGQRHLFKWVVDKARERHQR